MAKAARSALLSVGVGDQNVVDQRGAIAALPNARQTRHVRTRKTDGE
ncbi:MAG TPA: hypothetical protein VJ577_17945 [Burkholderiaceae bacterium]|nr:hypothetical protein [Burkholderiaceae bacterium]